MKNIGYLTVIAVSAVIIGVYGGEVENKQLGEPDDSFLRNISGYEDWQMIAFADMKGNKCVNKELGFEVQVKFGGLDEGILGQWRANDGEGYVIALEDVSVDTISHEVHHMVDYMSGRYGLDGENEAWMQGQFTQCVHDIVIDEIVND